MNPGKTSKVFTLSDKINTYQPIYKNSSKERLVPLYYNDKGKIGWDEISPIICISDLTCFSESDYNVEIDIQEGIRVFGDGFRELCICNSTQIQE